MKISLRTFVNISYLLATLILAVVGVAIYQNFQSVIQKVAWVNHTHRILAVSDKLTAYIKDAETAQHNYLINYDPADLVPYLTALDSIPIYFLSLQKLTQNNPAQRQKAIVLQQKIKSRLASLHHSIDLEDRQQATVLAQQKRKIKKDEIHDLMTTFIQSEQVLLQARGQELDRTIAFTKNVIYSIIVLAILCSIISLVYVSTQLHTKDRFEKELHRLNEKLSMSYEELATSSEEIIVTNEQLVNIRDQLEIKVNERTATLEETLEKLRAEIAQHQQTADALRKSERIFRVALENAPIAVFNHDTSLRYTWIYNPRLGSGVNQTWIGKTDEEILLNDNAWQITRLKQSVLDTGQGITEKIQLQEGDRNHSYILNIEPLFNDQKQIEGITGAMYEVTELKQSEDRLRETLQELKERNYELDNYVYKVSHDLRAPLTSIMGLIELIEMETDPGKISHYVQLIKNRINKSDDFIRSLLNHSKILNSEIDYVPIDFQEMIDTCIEELKYLSNASEIRFFINKKEETVFCGDKLRVGIIFKNFISNAIKYINPHAVDAPYLKFNIKVSAQEAYIVLEDNGMGIEKQYLDRIFNMFFRATEKSDGSGLGLYITQQTVHKLNGNIDVRSTLGEGTTFTLILPNQPMSAYSSLPESHERQEGRSA
ncbi:MAG: CHASE3 domain-containing protein [Bacteroidota bacterium]